MKKILSIIFILIWMCPMLGSGQEELYNDNLVIIMDCSGSMGGKKLREAKQALKEILNYVPETTQIGLLVFGGTYHGWRYALGPRDDATLNKSIDQLNAGGETPLGEYMRYGAEKLLEQHERQLGYGNYRLLVITDGEASDQKLVDQYTPEIMAKGITIDLIGVYMKKKHSLSQMVHSYREANDKDSLKEAISEVLAEITDRKDSQTSEDAFEIISGLPDGLTSNIINALSAPSDDSFGKKKPILHLLNNEMPSSRANAPYRQQKSSYINIGKKLFTITVIVVTLYLIKHVGKKKKR